MTTAKLAALTALLVVAVKGDYAPPAATYGVPSAGGDYNSYSVGGGAGGYSGGVGGYSGGGAGGYGGGAGGYGGGGHDEHHQAMPYEFGYAVKDHHYGTDFGQNEASDGHNVKGQYRVVLPDGRTQIVTYHADWKTGFHADVKYEGEARYPEPSSYGNHGGAGGNGGGYQYGVPAPPASDYTTADFGGHHSGGGYRR